MQTSIHERSEILIFLAAVPLLAACAMTPAAAPLPRTAPLIDYHQRLVSPAFAPIVTGPEETARRW
jgi:hypothetical protein